MVRSAVWALAWVGSFAAFALIGPTGEGFVRGMNRVTVLLGWQGVAVMLSIAVLCAGLAWPRRHPVRRASGIPLTLA